MLFDVYCDESFPDLFSSANPQGKYLVIGSLWLPMDKRSEYKAEVHELRDRYKMGRGEFKWSKISRSRLGFYKEVVDWYISKGDDLRFRCIVVENDKINLVKFHNGDQELGFYKFYYQMLHHWILDNNEYQIFCDLKTSSSKSRLDTLRQCLNNANRFAAITNIQATRSEQSVLLQLNDLLLGMASAKFNGSLHEDSPKKELLEYFESKFGRSIRATSRDERKYNVFQIDLRGGW